MSPPPSRPSSRRLEVDWVVVSVDHIRRWGLALLLVLIVGVLAVGGLLVLHEPVERKADRVLRQASSLQDELRRAGISETLANEFDQASTLLDEARHDWERKDFPACLARAEESLRRFHLLGGLTSRDFVGSGQIISAQGRVEVQRASQTTWERAKEKEPLYNGDFVKTSKEGAAEILFSDGTVYRVGADSLLEVHREARGGGQPSSGEVKIKVGQVNVYTASNPSLVLTDTARAEVDRESRIGVEVAEDTSATFSAYTGKAVVTGASGERSELGARQAISAQPAGGLSTRRAVPDPPLLQEPAANAVVNLDQSDRVLLGWRPVAAATGYELQLSRSRLFSPSALEFPPNRRTTNRAMLRILKPGTYYWRVAALSADRVRSEWSGSRTFRALAGARVEEIADTTPPRLEVSRPQQMGNLILLNGATEPGTSVTINGEVVEVGGDGTFKKAVALGREGWNTIVVRATDPAGNVAERKESVFVEVE